MVGTPVTIVTRCRSTASAHRSTSNRRWSTSVAAALTPPIMRTFWAATWNSGRVTRRRSAGPIRM